MWAEFAIVNEDNESICDELGSRRPSVWRIYLPLNSNKSRGGRDNGTPKDQDRIITSITPPAQ